MSSALEGPEYAITEEEMTGTAPSASVQPPRNAFSALMSKEKPKLDSKTSKPKKHGFDRRDGLGVYIEDPASFPASRVIYHNDEFVAIHDLYPKSSVHTLLLPRSPKVTFIHPFDAFEDPEFLASVRTEAAKLKKIVAAELQRLYGPFSAQDAPREAILNGTVDFPLDQPMPAGRNWEKEVKVGVHAHPSMNHLHVHVLSVDRFSQCMKHRKHYNSFSTPFFVDLEDFPLPKDDERRTKTGYLERDLKCWRCGMNFGNKFAKLKEHLAVEFEEWKKE